MSIISQKYVEINIQPKRETTFEEDTKAGLYKTVIGAMISDCYPNKTQRDLKNSQNGD
jgi:hypothetical protein